MDALKIILFIIAFFGNFGYAYWLGLFICDNESFKPYKGRFKIKHLGLIFVIPGMILAYVSIGIVAFFIFIVVQIVKLSKGKGAISRFLNKPLFGGKDD